METAKEVTTKPAHEQHDSSSQEASEVDPAAKEAML